MIKRIYLLLMLFGGCLFSMRAAVKEEIYVNHIADTVEIGNEFLARKFLVKNDKVRTCMIENKRMGKEVSRNHFGGFYHPYVECGFGRCGYSFF